MNKKVMKKLLDHVNYNDLLLEYLDNSETPVPTTKPHHVGIEIECFTPLRRRQVQEIVLKLDLEKVIQVGGDNSIRPALGCNNLELRCLILQNQLRATLTRIGKVLKMGKCRVNTSCGLHVHLDMRHRSFHECVGRLMCFQKMLFKMVNKDRRNNPYCVPSSVDTRHMRHTAINTQAYGEHNTIEVRMHHGTVDVKEIENWINLLLKVIKEKPKDLNTVKKTIAWASKDKKIGPYVASKLKNNRQAE